ncbi:MAG TPA: hypothetical protein VKT81_21345 [Bryobacteraceae bacterium]|nr:hypothetical protein [Bryobacteraceae bacterium]
MSNAASVTTILMAMMGLYVIFTRVKNWLESNVPLYFYIFLIIYMRAIDGDVPLWLSLAGLGCALILRFEFMNEIFIKIVKFAEFGVIIAISYLCVNMVWQL